MLNTSNTIYGTRLERVRIPISGLAVGIYFIEQDTEQLFQWNGREWCFQGTVCSGLPVRKFLTASFDGLGNYNLNGNYAVPTSFGYTADTPYQLHSLLIAITDNTSFNALDYGAITDGLVNGVSLWFRAAGQTPVPLVFSNPVKRNYEWLSHVAGTSLTTFAGNTQTLTVPLDIVSDYGVPLVMLTGDSFYVTLNDNFTSLIAQTFGIRGTKLG